MGTGWRVLVAVRPGAAVEPLHTAIQQRLDGLVAEMSHWLATSTLGRFNQAPAGSATVLPPDFAHVMAAALDIAARSGGAFDPALGRLTDCWGLGPRTVAQPPAADAIAAAQAESGWQRLTFDPAARRLHQPGGVWLDLSGIAKGHAADVVAAVIAAAEHGHALVEVGGECVGRGIRPDGDPWWVELEAPPGVALAPLRVALHQLAVATSGDYVRGAHTLDPRTGRPIGHDTAAVSVLHASAMIADAWASALTVIEPEAALALATREQLAARIVSRSGREWLSPALAAML
nr:MULTISPECIES: FAD:protein FMN transferase [unclassified Sphingomonas]